MFSLFAGIKSSVASEPVASEEFPDLDAAEARMRQWAQFGVDAYCNDPDAIWITDEKGKPVSFWDWRTRSARPAE